MSMDIDERERLLKKIIADLEYLISQCRGIEVREELEKALDILESNESLDRYDD